MSDDWTNEAIISDTLCEAPDVTLGSKEDGWRLSRWRHFVGSYALPPLPAPTFVVHIGGKSQVKTWCRDSWTETGSMPGDSTILPPGMASRWLVDGELDVVTLSFAPHLIDATPTSSKFSQLRFAFSDPLGTALTRQVLSELYAPASTERDAYVGTLVNALTAHVLRGTSLSAGPEIPSTQSSAFRLHTVMAQIKEHPEADHGLESLAAAAGLTPSHFCRVFRKATGSTPHQFVMRTKLDRARHLLVQSELPVAQISDSLGFKSQSHFTRTYRQYFHETPSDFRRRGKEAA